jgi:hypothetical protein
MAAVTLAWTGARFLLLNARRHRRNAELWAHCRRDAVRVVAIDGPCATNGLAVRSDWSGWDRRRRGAQRDAEIALAKERIGLFWTTHATVVRFEGASRWIARSLRLFGDDLGARPPERIEVHPHGMFTVLSRRLGRGDPPNKHSPAGRRARIAILRRYVPELDGALQPDHDAVDAAAAAVMAGLHALRLTRPLGTHVGGGLIWLPRIDRTHDRAGHGRAIGAVL